MAFPRGASWNDEWTIHSLKMHWVVAAPSINYVNRFQVWICKMLVRGSHCTCCSSSRVTVNILQFSLLRTREWKEVMWGLWFQASLCSAGCQGNACECSQKLETGTKCQIDRSGFLCNKPNMAVWWKNLHLVVMETSVHLGCSLPCWKTEHKGWKYARLEKLKSFSLPSGGWWVYTTKFCRTAL